MKLLLLFYVFLFYLYIKNKNREGLCVCPNGVTPSPMNPICTPSPPVHSCLSCNDSSFPPSCSPSPNEGGDNEEKYYCCEGVCSQTLCPDGQTPPVGATEYDSMNDCRNNCQSPSPESNQTEEDHTVLFVLLGITIVIVIIIGVLYYMKISKKKQNNSGISKNLSNVSSNNSTSSSKGSKNTITNSSKGSTNNTITTNSSNNSGNNQGQGRKLELIIN